MHFSSADYWVKEYKVLYRVHHLTCTIHSIVQIDLTSTKRVIVKLDGGTSRTFSIDQL
jgi:hypothetical protein